MLLQDTVEKFFHTDGYFQVRKSSFGYFHIEKKILLSLGVTGNNSHVAFYFFHLLVLELRKRLDKLCL